MTITAQILKFLENHPGSSYIEIASHIDKKPKDTTSKLSNLKYRGLVYNQNKLWYAGKPKPNLSGIYDRMHEIARELHRTAYELEQIEKLFN